jgi:serine phosphatase RsbU (regulator of sigma subunit)/pSer/pThr/pTyr-binding forkhead associated (FHA) protein
MAILRALKGANPGQLFPIEGEAAILGRHPECDIVLEAAAVSRQHARIVNVGGNYFVEDLASRNGTYLNGRVVVNRQPLAENDEIQICDLVFVFHEGPPTVPVPGTKAADVADVTAMMIDDEEPTGNSAIMSTLDISGGSSGLKLETNAQAKLKALIEIGQSLGKAVGLSDVLARLMDGLFSIFVQADRGFIILKDKETGKLVPRAIKHRRADDAATIRVSRTIINDVMKSREAILSADAASDSRFGMAESIIDFHIRSMMCAPLIGNDGRAFGVLQIDTQDPRSRFSRDDLDVLGSVACQAAFAVENAQLHESVLRERAMERELSLAHQVQQGFLPTAAPRLPGYDFFEFYEPANKLGGDYFDYVHLPGGRLGIVVADVSGKGIAASLLMARLSAETRYCLASEPTPDAAVGRLNRIFCDRSWEDRFVTFVLVVLDPVRHELTVVNAGHMAPLMRRRDGTVDSIAEADAKLPLGVDYDVTYIPSTHPISAGDCVVLYTDGITEAMNNADELYGRGRLLAQLRGDVEGVRALGLRILDDVKQFVGKRSQSDDMCLTCFGRGK